MTYVLGLDFETTGLDPATCEVTEIGAVIWDWEAKKPINPYSQLVKIEGDISTENRTLTGISKEDTERWGTTPERAFGDLGHHISQCEYVMAHNAQFDRGFLEASFNRIFGGFPEIQWLCSREDIQYPKHIVAKNLLVLSAQHGFLNHFPHRAVTDVLTMLKVASDYPLDEIVRVSKSPVATLVSLEGFDRKDDVKGAGFHWRPETKTWETRVKDCFLADFANKLAGLNIRFNVEYRE